MKRLLISFMFLFSIVPVNVSAELYSQSMLPLLMDSKLKRYRDSIYLKVDIGLGTWCYVISDEQFYKVPRQWTPALNLIVKNMNPLTTEQSLVCDGTFEWRVAELHYLGMERLTRPMYSYTNNLKGKSIGRVDIGSMCESDTIKASRGYKEWRYSTNTDGKRGIVLCEETLAE